MNHTQRFASCHISRTERFALGRCHSFTTVHFSCIVFMASGGLL